MAKWIRKAQECEGTYLFKGKMLVSREVHETIPLEEILQIFSDTRKAVTELGGLDYLQVFENENGTKLYFIDSVNKETLESGEFDPDDFNYNNCVLCYPHER
ncbi:hypothetical protein [Leadbetterella sp. DM7]|uniref:hypothetical protein n=1 Tax=Leadbetterella sp. DM7 TaxID=3235085 RepID=UPI00349E8DA4